MEWEKITSTTGQNWNLFKKRKKKKLKLCVNTHITIDMYGHLSSVHLPVNLQQINIISAKALQAFLYTFSDIWSINPQNVCIVT